MSVLLPPTHRYIYLSLVNTWELPSGVCYDEIDNVIVNRRFCITDVAVVPKLYMGSGHRLLCARFFSHAKEEGREIQEAVSPLL